MGFVCLWVRRTARFPCLQWRTEGAVGGFGGSGPPRRNSEVLTKLSRIPSSVGNTSVTTCSCPWVQTPTYRPQGSNSQNRTSRWHECNIWIYTVWHSRHTQYIPSDTAGTPGIYRVTQQAHPVYTVWHNRHTRYIPSDTTGTPGIYRLTQQSHPVYTALTQQAHPVYTVWHNRHTRYIPSNTTHTPGICRLTQLLLTGIYHSNIKIK
jgi:hypothetical protein